MMREDSMTRRFITFRATLPLFAVAGLLWPQDARAQKPTAPAAEKTTSKGLPTLKSISPPAASRGADVVWKVSGSNLAKVDRWLISGEGVEILPAKPPTDTEAELRVSTSQSARLGFRELRAIAPEGLSNLKIIRVDFLEPRDEIEPNDRADQAQTVSIGMAVHGLLKEREYDHYKIDLLEGQLFTAEVEAQRLGQPLSPTLTLIGPDGQALAQANDTRGLEHDSRISLRVPSSGTHLLQVRDAVYLGSDQSLYRLRLHDGLVATALFPLAARRGSRVEIEAFGGSILEPLRQTLILDNNAPDFVGTLDFAHPEGDISAPMRLLATDASDEPLETQETANPEGMPLPFGGHVNGRIERPGQIDRYRIAAQKDQRFVVRIRASEMGSWLDSVVRVVDASGSAVAENDDAGINQANNDVSPFTSQTALTPDSRVEVEPKADGDLIIEVFDRYSEGGPEYGYRLQVGPSEPDFQLAFLFGDPNLGRRRAFGQAAQVPRGPGANGAINLKPNSSVPINFLISSDGTIGKFVVKAEGLPTGVTAAPVTISLPIAPKARTRAPTASGGAIVLKVETNAPANLGALRLVAVAKPEGSSTELVRTATARILVDAVTQPGGAAAGRMASRELREIPVWVAGRIPPKTEDSSSGQTQVVLLGAQIPGVLLQGGQIDLPLLLEPEAPPSNAFEVSAEAIGPGFVAQTLVTEGPSSAEVPRAVVRLIASPDSPVGVTSVRVRLKSAESETVRDIPVIVRAPFRLTVLHTALNSGTESAETKLRVSVNRESGFLGVIDLQLAVPDGLSVVESPPWQIAGDSILLTVTGKPTLQPGQIGPANLEIKGSTRMPRGVVWSQLTIPSMFDVRRADEKP